MFGRIYLCIFLVLTFPCWEVLITDSVPLLVCLLRFLISSWVNLSNLCVSRNLSICSRLSGLLVYNSSVFYYNVFSYNVFYFCEVNSNVPTFISEFSYLCLLFFLRQSIEGLSVLLIFFQRSNFCFHRFSLLFFYFVFSVSLIFIIS